MARSQVLVVGVSILLLAAAGYWLTSGHVQPQAALPSHAPAHAADEPALDAQYPDTLSLPQSTVRGMRLEARPAKINTQPQTLRMTGQIMLDPNRLVHVSARFSGEVVEVAPKSADDKTALRAGDRVHKGQVLAILWSKEIGEKKSDLVDALSQKALDEALYNNLKSLEKTGGVSKRTIEEKGRDYDQDRIQVDRIMRTLRSWRVGEDEITECEDEADRIRQHADPAASDGKNKLDRSRLDADWAKVDIISPIDGVIMEKNLTVGDIVNTNDDLFKIADLGRLMVMANIFEEDISQLVNLPDSKKIWEVRTGSKNAAPIYTGRIESVGNVIDPNQHTAIVQGWIENPCCDLRVGQFVETVIELPVPVDRIAVPVSGVIDDGARKYVFVALNDDLTSVQRREIKLERRSTSLAILSNEPPQGVQVNERVLTRGVMELASVLAELQSNSSRQ
jgi:cobalt-zinc-cadmium efflux system membrane fusion protein